MLEVRKYSRELADDWNTFVSTSKNGTFLLNRSYMDYHQDRFTDNSLIVYDRNRIHALLPANAIGDVLYSHQGLTYGGLITDKKTKAAEVCSIFTQLKDYLKTNDFNKMVYKAIPWIYQQLPSGEDLYALTNVCDAKLASRQISSTIIMSNRIGFDNSRKGGVRIAKRESITVRESDDISTFWKIMDDNLSNKYNVHPVHTLGELTSLKVSFPNNIRLFMAYQGETPLGGTILYVTPQVIHVQYISATPSGKRLRALDEVFNHVINLFGENYKYFDFGTSNEDNGRYLNEKLIFQKEGFGGRGVCYDTYEFYL